MVEFIFNYLKNELTHFKQDKPLHFSFMVAFSLFYGFTFLGVVVESVDFVFIKSKISHISIGLVCGLLVSLGYLISILINTIDKEGKQETIIAMFALVIAFIMNIIPTGKALLVMFSKTIFFVTEIVLKFFAEN